MSHRNGAGVRKAKALLECLRRSISSREVLSCAAILHHSPHPLEKKDEFILQQSQSGHGGDLGKESSPLGKSLTELGACLILQKDE